MTWPSKEILPVLEVKVMSWPASMFNDLDSTDNPSAPIKSRKKLSAGFLHEKSRFLEIEKKREIFCKNPNCNFRFWTFT